MYVKNTIFFSYSFVFQRFKTYFLISLLVTTDPTRVYLQDVCRSMAEKIGFSDPEDDSLCFSLNECTDGVTSE